MSNYEHKENTMDKKDIIVDVKYHMAHIQEIVEKAQQDKLHAQRESELASDQSVKHFKEIVELKKQLERKDAKIELLNNKLNNVSAKLAEFHKIENEEE